MQSKSKLWIIGVSALVLAMIAGISLWLSIRHEYKELPGVTTSPVEIKPQRTEVVASGLIVPWDLAFLPDGGMLVTERVGNLVYINTAGSKISIKIPRTIPRGEGGLLGLVLHPQFDLNRYLYLYMTTQTGSGGTTNAVFRYRLDDNRLIEERAIITEIPGAMYHDGGRLEFGPDGMLYITTGDAQDENIAQDKNSLGGKILRLLEDGGIPRDNPFGTAVYSYGHRNPQGLAWDEKGRLWETEHGRSGVLSGLDEVNLIVKGGNYGWPTIEGDETGVGMMNPVLHSGASDTWAPASLVYLNGSLYFGGLRGEALYEAVLADTNIIELKTHLHREYGRIRTVRLGPDQMLYLTTSNRDGRGESTQGDDRIVRVHPDSL